MKNFDCSFVDVIPVWDGIFRQIPKEWMKLEDVIHSSFISNGDPNRYVPELLLSEPVIVADHNDLSPRMEARLNETDIVPAHCPCLLPS
jgi:hypothetical protein